MGSSELTMATAEPPKESSEPPMGSAVPPVVSAEPPKDAHGVIGQACPLSVAMDGAALAHLRYLTIAALLLGGTRRKGETTRRCVLAGRGLPRQLYTAFCASRRGATSQELRCACDPRLYLAARATGAPLVSAKAAGTCARSRHDRLYAKRGAQDGQGPRTLAIASAEMARMLVSWRGAR